MPVSITWVLQTRVVHHEVADQVVIADNAIHDRADNLDGVVQRRFTIRRQSDYQRHGDLWPALSILDSVEARSLGPIQQLRKFSRARRGGYRRRCNNLGVGHITGAVAEIPAFF
jgi:hypothetical protein